MADLGQDFRGAKSNLTDDEKRRHTSIFFVNLVVKLNTLLNKYSYIICLCTPCLCSKQ